MQFRHEVKHEISNHDMLILRQRLRAVMKPDAHAVNGRYEIRSLYFDSLDDKALREKLDGVNVREKYRIRLYNNDPSVIHLERKFKQGSLGYKTSASLTPEQAQAIADGNIEWMSRSTDEVILGFYTRIRNEGLAAKVIVDYTREPFIYVPGNVRVTLDYNIRTGMSCKDFLNPACVTVPVKDSPCILEVKWDNFLPDVIRDAVQLDGRKSAAYSKYAASRMYD
ncbi:MAG: polyphosphate polymerase domain-containing protein [Clostridia bacterium]|nr:polyphosphate polymerase domain-containing protein [Clostridia bacterium]